MKLPEYPYSFTPGDFESVKIIIGKRLKELSSPRILVAGSQFGELALRTAKHYSCHVTGIETDTEALIYSRMGAETAGLGSQTDFQYMDSDTLAFPDATFDFVIADNIFSMFHRKNMVEGFFRVLAPNGTLGIMDSFWLKQPVPNFVREVWETKNTPVLLKEEWEALLTEAGFNIELVRDNSQALPGFYRQFTGDIKKIADSHFTGLKPYKSLVKHFKHEIDVYTRHGGDKYMGHLLVRCSKP